MTPKERAAMQQALEALESCKPEDTTTSYYVGKDYDESAVYDAITALREALEQPDEIDWIETNKSLAKEIIELKKQAEQEPVAWYSVKGGFNTCGEGKPLYTAPVRTKDLTDDEIVYLWNRATSDFDFARAVIAVDREKNK